MFMIWPTLDSIPFIVNNNNKKEIPYWIQPKKKETVPLFLNIYLY